MQNNDFKRYLGLDIGDVRIGVAVSDPLGMFATPIEVYKRVSVKNDIEKIKGYISLYSIKGLVAGIPYNLKGEEGQQAKKAASFINELKKSIDINIELIDERFTTSEAEKLLIEDFQSRDSRRLKKDKIAASLILQTYLDNLNMKKI